MACHRDTLIIYIHLQRIPYRVTIDLNLLHLLRCTETEQYSQEVNEVTATVSAQTDV